MSRNTLRAYKSDGCPCLIPIGSGVKAGASAQDTVYTLIEKFENYTAADGIMLPQTYSLKFTINGQNTALMIDWNASFAQFKHNLKMDPVYFSGKF